MQVREIIEQENHEVEFDSPFGKVVVSAEKNMYTSLRKKYQELAKTAAESMENCIINMLDAKIYVNLENEISRQQQKKQLKI